MKSALTMGLSAAVVMALFVSIAIDIVNATKGGAIDFRSRIVGVRLLEHGLDAYRYKWHEGAPQQYCIATDNTTAPLSGVTVTPALLMLHMPLAKLPYRRAQFLFLAVQWLLLAGTVWVWYRYCPSWLLRWLVVVFAVGFTYTASWRLHSERGQAYLLLTFLFACWLTATLDPKLRNSFIAGCLAGFLATLRPTYIMIVPFLALHRRGQMPGVAAGLLLGFTLPLLMNPAGWSDYFSAMQIHTLLYRTGVHFPPTPQSLPPTIDGMPTPLIGGFVPIHSHDFSGYFFLRQLSSTAISELLMTLTLVVPFVFWLWWTRRESTSRLLPAMAAWFFLIDLFVPAPRYSYYDVIILNVVFAGVVTTGKIPWAVWPCVVGTLLGWAVYFLQPNRPLWIVLPEDFFTMGVVLFLFTPPKPKEDATGPMAGHPSPATP